MRILCAAMISFCAMSSPIAASELTARQLAALYPPDEHCLFVPPPNWPGLFRPDRHEASSLSADRLLAQKSAQLLQALNEAVIYLLQPDLGLTQEDIERGGKPLRRIMTAQFRNYAELWRATNANNHAIDLASLAHLQSACNRRAIMVLNNHGDSGASATVISLITGNRLAKMVFH